jgi:ACS family hexuronate transporter-like MFS transporter
MGAASVKVQNLRWYIITLVFLVTGINYVHRQTLSVAIPVIRDQYGLSNTDYARIVFMFMLAYTVMQMISGKLIDRFGTRMGFTLIFSWWSVAVMLHATARGIWGFCVFRFLLGMGQAGNWPGATKTIAEWFPPKERAFAAGFFNSGSSLGAVVAPPLISWIIIRLGWRAGFVLTGALGFIWLIGWLLLYYSPEKHPLITENERVLILQGRGIDPKFTGPGLRWLDLFRYRQVWALMLGRALADPVWWFYAFWLPEYLRRQRSFSLGAIGTFAWIPFFAMGIGSFAGGGLSSYLVKRGWKLSLARKAVLLPSAVAMSAGIPAVLTPSAACSLVFISAATFAYGSYAAVFIALPTDIFPKEVVASVYGIAGSAAAFGGMAFTLTTGKVVDRFSYLPIFVAAGILPVIAVALLLLLIGRIEALSIQQRNVLA